MHEYIIHTLLRSTMKPLIVRNYQQKGIYNEDNKYTAIFPLDTKSLISISQILAMFVLYPAT